MMNLPVDSTDTKPAVLFDLDGTLIDPAGGITQGIAYALRSMGLAVPEEAVLSNMVGPKLSESLLALPGFPPEQLAAVVAKYRGWYSERGIAMGKPYPGIPELLKKLQEQGFLIALATQKPLSLAHVLLQTHGLAHYFQTVSGAEENEALSDDDGMPPKQRIIALALAGLSQPQRAVMVGDRAHDVLGARANDLDCFGVSWGFSAAGELDTVGALRVVSSAEELATGLHEYFAAEVVHGAL
ncbi:HAD hydrolase-like protein [Psychromicrobium silvestre]|nr:HAD hydrolase-like protein [Psychromicrobium silvestre]